MPVYTSYVCVYILHMCVYIYFKCMYILHIYVCVCVCVCMYSQKPHLYMVITEISGCLAGNG